MVTDSDSKQQCVLGHVTDFILRHGLADSFESPLALAVVETEGVRFRLQADEVFQVVVSAFILSKK